MRFHDVIQPNVVSVRVYTYIRSHYASVYRARKTRRIFMRGRGIGVHMHNVCYSTHTGHIVHAYARTCCPRRKNCPLTTRCVHLTAALSLSLFLDPAATYG